MSWCPPGTEMRRYYGGVVVSVIIDLVCAALYFWLRFVHEPRTAARRKAKHSQQLGGNAAVAVGLPVGADAEIYELQEGLLKGAPGDYSMLTDAPPAAEGLQGSQVYTMTAKKVLEQGFKRCNANLHLDLSFSDLGFTLPPPHSKTILSGVSGRIKPGRVTAVMGPSGAGKTTFLSVLMGKYQRTAGVLRINGEPDEMQRYNRIVGFVPQDDTMMRELTVRENITFSARVRLPRHGWTDEDIERHVDAVIEVLGLRECADTLSDHVSGGQRKRTNIGMELAMAPAAIFLDEPTSGLDSTAALEVCRTLRAIADLGLTVVAVIHQPRYEIFTTFDDLLLLAPGGITVYIGPQKGVLGYFEELGYSFSKGFNPADDLLDFVAGTPPSHGAADRVDSDISLSSVGGDDGDVAQGAGAGAGGVRYRTAAPGAAGKLAPPASPASMATSSGLTIGQRLAEQWNTRGMAYLARFRAQLGMTPMKEDGSGMLFGATTGSASAFGSTNDLTAMGSAITVSIRNIDPTTGLQTPVKTLGSVQSPPSVSAGIGGSGAVDDAEGHSHARFDPVAMTADRGATWWRQFVLCHNRSVLQQYRQISSYALEMGVGMLAGGMMGAAASQLPELYVGILKPPYTLISPAPIETLLPSIGLYVSLAVGLAGSPAGVRTFGEERHVYFREATSGHSVSAYYVAKTVSMVYRFTLGAFHFASVFHILANPSTPFPIMFLTVLLQYYSVYGLAAITSMVVRRENSALLGVIASLIAACLCGFGPSLVQFRNWHIGFIQDMSYARWASEAWFHYETLPYRDLYMVEEVSAPLFGYTLDRFGLDCGMIVLIGFVMRVIAYGLLILLRYTHKERR